MLDEEQQFVLPRSKRLLCRQNLAEVQVVGIRNPHAEIHIGASFEGS
ncbi:hypothetical protein [Rhizobium alvei]|uniref:Uncharacterized protein n=1 Tax=Rhizobium alvei TaxID=1132659 RepID=A0ABT8YRM9_9HYPH|nr:hypothetical protein [Rhizobium alvei]MDO6966333.1 hypothetical protein [Rhizobium alvei]